MLNTPVQPQLHRLTPLQTSRNLQSPSLVQYLKENSIDGESSNDSFILLLGKSTHFKSSILAKLLSLQTNFGLIQSGSTLYAPDEFGLEIAKSHENHSFICNITLQQSPHLTESDMKLLLFSMTISDSIVLIISPEDLEDFSFRYIIEGVRNRNTPEGHKVKIQHLIIVFQARKTSPDIFYFQEIVKQKLQSEWILASTPGQLTSLSLPELLKTDLVSCPSFEEDAISFSQALKNIRKLLSFQPKEPPHYFLSQNSSPVFIKPNPLQERVTMNTFNDDSTRLSSTGPWSLQKPKEKLIYQDMRYSVPFDRTSWNPIEVPRTIIMQPELIDLRAEEEFEELRKKIYRDSLFELIELRRKVEASLVLNSFGSEGKILYNHAVKQFDEQTRKFHLMPMFANKKRIFMDKLETDLYELFEIQVKHVKKQVKANLIKKLEEERGNIQRNFERNIALVLELEIERVIADLHIVLDRLRVFATDDNPRWDIEIIIEEIRRDLLKFRKEYVESLSESMLKGIMMDIKNKLQTIVDAQFANPKSGFWEKIEREYRITLDQKEVVLRGLWQDDPLSAKFGIEHRIAAFFRECSQFLLDIIKEKTKKLSDVLVADFFTRVETEWHNKREQWLAEGQEFAFERIRELAQKIRQEEINTILEFKWEKISLDVRNFSSIKEASMIGLPRPFLSDEECEEIKRKVGEEVELYISQKKFDLSEDAERNKTDKIKKEFLFWVMWVIFLYLQMRYLRISSLWALMGLFFLWKIIEYSGVTVAFQSKMRTMAKEHNLLGKRLSQDKTSSALKGKPSTGESAKKRVIKFSAPKNFFKDKQKMA